MGAKLWPVVQYRTHDPVPRHHLLVLGRPAAHHPHVDVPVTSTDGAEGSSPGSEARLAAIRLLLLDQTLPPGPRPLSLNTLRRR